MSKNNEIPDEEFSEEEAYDGTPDFVHSQAGDNGQQDDLGEAMEDA